MHCLNRCWWIRSNQQCPDNTLIMLIVKRCTFGPLIRSKPTDCGDLSTFECLIAVNNTVTIIHWCLKGKLWPSITLPIYLAYCYDNIMWYLPRSQIRPPYILLGWFVTHPSNTCIWCFRTDSVELEQFSITCIHTQ